MSFGIHNDNYHDYEETVCDNYYDDALDWRFCPDLEQCVETGERG